MIHLIISGTNMDIEDLTDSELADALDIILAGTQLST